MPLQALRPCHHLGSKPKAQALEWHAAHVQALHSSQPGLKPMAGTAWAGPPGQALLPGHALGSKPTALHSGREPMLSLSCGAPCVQTHSALEPTMGDGHLYLRIHDTPRIWRIGVRGASGKVAAAIVAAVARKSERRRWLQQWR